jgi:hypothetical protein
VWLFDYYQRHGGGYSVSFFMGEGDVNGGYTDFVGHHLRLSMERDGWSRISPSPHFDIGQGNFENSFPQHLHHCFFGGETDSIGSSGMGATVTKSLFLDRKYAVLEMVTAPLNGPFNPGDLNDIDAGSGKVA